MKITRSYLLWILTAGLFLSGCAGSYYLSGTRFYDQMAYSKAIPKLEKALSMKNFPDGKHKLADAYRRMNNSVEAEKWYKEVVGLPDARPEEVLYYAQSMMQNGKYAEAKEMLKQYTAKTPGNSAAVTLLNSCDSVGALKKDSANYIVELLSINSGSSMAPVYYNNGLVFTSDRTGSKKVYDWTGRPFLKLYYSKDNGNGNFQTPEMLKGPVNGIYHDGPATFSPDGHTMYFTRNSYINKKVEKSSAQVVLLKICQAQRNDKDEWTDVKELPFNGKDFSCGHPSMSSDGKTLYFISDMPGGLGGTDIWMVKKDGDNWSAPVNLGSEVNTPLNEMFPNINGDSALFFSSEGHYTLGGLDVFQSNLKDGKWSQAKNLGYPINTSKDDFGYILDKKGESGYLTSNRNSSDGSIDNLFRFTKPEPKFNLNGIVVDKKTQEPIGGAEVTLLNKKTGKKESATAGKDGKFHFTISGNTDYAVTAEKQGYFSDTKEVSTIGKQPGEDLFVKLELQKLEIDKPIVLKNIYYDFDKANIRPDAAIELDKLVKVLKDNPTIKIELSSHTDCRGTDAYNQRLSKRRAESAVKYIIERGIDKDRITAKGYGETTPVVKCDPCEKCNEEEHQLNRRTEFKVVGYTE